MTQKTEGHEIPEALSPEEWDARAVERDPWDSDSDCVFRIAEVHHAPGCLLIDSGGPDWDSVEVPQAMRHALAALALDGLEIDGVRVGFTWEDVDDEESAARTADEQADRAKRHGMSDGLVARYRGVASRARRRAAVIASLLPARETTKEVSGG